MKCRMLSAAVLLGTVVPGALTARAQAPAAAAKAPEPSQAAVLAENTVFRANVAYGSGRKATARRLFAAREPLGLPSSFSFTAESGRGMTRRT